jgi:hypothetical protein
VRGRLLALDVALLVAAALLGLHLYRVVAGAPPREGRVTPVGGRASAAIDGVSGAAATSRRPAAVSAPAVVAPRNGYAVIAERNPFSPTRSEAGPPAREAPVRARLGRRPTPPHPGRPVLYGVVLGAADGPRAYLRDPATNRLTRCAVGDLVAGNRIEAIRVDRVVLRQPDGTEWELALHDPSRRRRAVIRPPAR